jgi:hypothetical protein
LDHHGFAGFVDFFFTSTSSVGVNPFIEPAEMNITPNGYEEPKILPLQ